MYRILGILASFVACSTLIVWSVAATIGPEALTRGAAAYVYREFFDRILSAPVPAPRPLVVWLGDSTIIARFRPSYPQLLRPELLGQGADSLVIAGAGFDAYVHYFLIGRVLELQPAVVVIVAHLAGFHLKREAFTYNDTCSYLLPSQLPRTFLLPLAERQLSPARVLLAQTLNLALPKQILYATEGLRLRYQEAPVWEALGPPKPPIVFNPAFRDALMGYEISLSRNHPTVRMLEASVRAVTEAGHSALVVASPIPYEAMQQRGWYDAAKTQGRIDVLRAATEDAGGVFADLHLAVTQAEFADFGGHLGSEGAQRVSNAVWPLVRGALRRAAAARTTAARGDDPAP